MLSLCESMGRIERHLAKLRRRRRIEAFHSLLNSISSGIIEIPFQVHRCAKIK